MPETHPDTLILADVAAERTRQDETWGSRRHLPDTHGPRARFPLQSDQAEALLAGGWEGLGLYVEACARADLARGPAWAPILAEEVGEALVASTDAERREELVQVAAVAVAWIDAIDRRTLAEGPIPGDMPFPLGLSMVTREQVLTRLRAVERHRDELQHAVLRQERERASIHDRAVEACAKLIERVRVRQWSPAEAASQIRERCKFGGRDA